MAQYEELLKQVLQRGVKSTDRTGTGTRRLQGLQLRYDLNKGFPMVTSKAVSFGYIKKELKWMLDGSTSQKTLVDKFNCTIWDEWADKFGRLGPVYGAMFRRRPAAKITNITVPVDMRVGERLTAKQASSHIEKNKKKYGFAKLRQNPLFRVWVRMLHTVAAVPAAASTNPDVPDTLQRRSVAKEWLDFNVFAQDFYELPGCELVHDEDQGSWFFYTYNARAGLFAKDTLQIVETYKERLIAVAMTETYAMHDTGIYDKIVVPRFYIDQIAEAIAEIKTRPDSRRIIVDAWEPSLLPIGGVSPNKQPEIGHMALAPCHCMFQFFVNPNPDGGKAKLSLHLLQRSADAVLGIPYNIASYALLTHLVAIECGLDVDEFIWTGGDCHIYENHIPTLRNQLRRESQNYDLPKLVIDPAVTSLATFEPSLVKLEGYKHGPKTEYPVAV